jgi:hypothetical protein
MKVFIWVLQEAGVRNVPSFNRLREMQDKLRGRCGVPTVQFKSPQGNIYYANDIRTLIAKVLRYCDIVISRIALKLSYRTTPIRL